MGTAVLFLPRGVASAGVTGSVAVYALTFVLFVIGTLRLVAGHAKYGQTGTPWVRIKKDKKLGPKLKHRNNTQLKDKWRNIEKAEAEKAKWA